MATRLYLALSVSPTTEWGISPGFAAWGRTTGGLRRVMVPQINAGDWGRYIDALGAGGSIAGTAGLSQLYKQQVSPPMIEGLAFTTDTTFKMQIMGLESAINDNIINRVRVVKIVSRDGGTVQSTQVALGNAASVLEWSTTSTNLSFLTGQTGANYTTVAGDRLVVEYGYLDSAGATIAATMRGGVTGQTGDLGENETDTTTTLRPWFETSLDLVFEADAHPLISNIPFIPQGRSM